MIIALIGPTCSGKSAIAIELAKHFHGEIINCDAFQVYKELNVGTAKPTIEEMELVPHHLFDFVSPRTNYSVRDFQIDFRKTLDELISKNIPAIIVGGTGLYLKASIMDYSFNDEAENDMSKFEDYTNEELYEILMKIDPEDAKKMHPNNRKRVLRSIAIYHLNGKSKTDLIKQQEHKYLYELDIFGIDIPREELYQRINNRVDKMVKDGLFIETKNLLKKYGKNHQCFQAIGYREIIESPNGEVDQISDQIKKNTRNYAKRQITFFKHQLPVKWVKDIDEIYSFLKNDSKIESK